jgi:hypothetical protein
MCPENKIWFITDLNFERRQQEGGSAKVHASGL